MAGPQFTGAIVKYPARSALAAYVGLIVFGTLILLLPVCHASHDRPLTITDAAFMSTSAVCVTGLTVCSVSHDLSLTGQIVLLALVQLGGIGIITATTLFSFGRQRGTNFRQQLAVTEALGSRLGDDPRLVVRTVVTVVLGIEFIGFLALFVRALFDQPVAEAAWTAMFHSITAFCNAGFALSDNSLVPYQTDVTINLVLPCLMILGGIGFPVMLELVRGFRDNRLHWFHDLSLHAQFVLWGTASLLVLGTGAFLFLEHDNTLAGLGWFDQLMIAFFHSSTCRSGGFNTVPIDQLTDAMLFISILLMVIGGAPCSTAGGIKVSTFMVLVVIARDRLRGFTTARFARRTISEMLIDRSVAVVLLFLLVIGLGLTLLLSVELVSTPHTESGGLFIETMFEVVSATCTVGLSTGLTQQLGEAGRILLIPLMLIGRLGPFSLFVAVSRERRDIRLKHAKEDVLIG